MSIKSRLLSIAESRPPDKVIGGESDPYLLRWHIIPRNPFFNIFIHCFVRSDDKLPLHDHSWSSISYLLKGLYADHTLRGFSIYHEGDWVFRLRASEAHRIELVSGHCWTLFITFFSYRKPGFVLKDKLGNTKWISEDDYFKSVKSNV